MRAILSSRYVQTRALETVIYDELLRAFVWFNVGANWVGSLSKLGKIKY